ncbi:hypothetical protein HDF24_22010 [Mucilaginibacter sp. X4EP1]|uniref:hypothetical protein n=1 Tax=Mucilaginibacter sp. X4EP1 TaxID=2723092 RepID=UPI002168F994|nr:hypothetical protein [Mucilaginibacter sp. X4EP1]MCS3812338.1 hypothetical protein [Mucilaginibacter sp. X4EP1]
MKKNLIVAIFCIFFGVVFCSGCEKLHVQIGNIKNNTKTDLVGAEWGEFMADSMLCEDKINLDYYLQPGLSEELSIRPDKGELSALPDSSKQYIYIFNSDSLDKYQKLKMCDGIVKRCLVKKIEIQLNKVKEPMDTVFINAIKP